MSNKNPHHLCIWEDEANCSACELNRRLHCHFNKKYSIMFGLPFLVMAVPALIGLILLNFPLNLISILVWIAYMFFFFLVWEPPILCAHCPFYAEGETKILHCSINYGFFKTAKFNPKPINVWEKIQFLIGANLLFVIPVIFLIVGQKWIFLGISLFGLLLWYIMLQWKICSDCINFSCVLNRVPKEIQKKFIAKNQETLKSWNKK
ncbi:MAG: hypothetical protein ACTSSG_04815 [Candidatus Heimdallarchaeaceae archaeon]